MDRRKTALNGLIFILAMAVVFALALAWADTVFAANQELTIEWSYPENKVANEFQVYDKNNVQVGQFDGAARTGEYTYNFTGQCEPFYLTADWTNPDTGVAKESPISQLVTVCLDPVEAPSVETFVITIKKLP